MMLLYNISRYIKIFITTAVILLVLTTILPVLLLRWMDPPTSSFMLQRKISAWLDDRKDFNIRYKWTDIDKISRHALIAVMAAEDQKFPNHWGFDSESIIEALYEKIKGIRVRGASTISQQVAKNLFLWPGKSFIRKGIEAYFTVLIELLWPKRRIIEVYLNIAELGDGVFGIGAASKKFFRKPPIRLRRRECALLAAVLPNPIRLRVDRPSKYVQSRSTMILREMYRLEKLHYLKKLSQALGLMGCETQTASVRQQPAA
jgi:monofunctional biosynthetic peptidoglycan transglycosylase